MNIEWKDGFHISVSVTDGTVTVSADEAGLLSLSEQLRSLASENPGAHIHYDCFNSLEENSSEMIIEKIR